MLYSNKPKEWKHDITGYLMHQSGLKCANRFWEPFGEEFLPDADAKQPKGIAKARDRFMDIVLRGLDDFVGSAENGDFSCTVNEVLFKNVQTIILAETTYSWLDYEELDGESASSSLGSEEDFVFDILTRLKRYLWAAGRKAKAVGSDTYPIWRDLIIRLERGRKKEREGMMDTVKTAHTRLWVDSQLG